MEGKLYVLIRADLSVPQQGVQAGHAVAQWCKEWYHFTMQNWGNGTLIYVTVKNMDWLFHWMSKLEKGTTIPTTWSVFYEEDLDGMPTALACYTEDEKLFAKLPLWNPTVS